MVGNTTTNGVTQRTSEPPAGPARLTPWGWYCAVPAPQRFIMITLQDKARLVCLARFLKLTPSAKLAILDKLSTDAKPVGMHLIDDNNPIPPHYKQLTLGLLKWRSPEVRRARSASTHTQPLTSNTLARFVWQTDQTNMPMGGVRFLIWVKNDHIDEPLITQRIQHGWMTEKGLASARDIVAWCEVPSPFET